MEGQQSSLCARSVVLVAAAAYLVSFAGCTPLGEDVTPPLTVAVTEGSVTGELSADGSVRVFRGIPYAAPPVGERRWRAPQPVEPWDGERQAVAFSPGCAQSLRAEGSFYGPGADTTSEDCLYLNVWTAADTAAPQPVMVWIHGGALRNGEGARPTYNGERLAQRGVVLVTLNYRLGPFGFLAHPLLSAEDEHGSSGNYGFLDQLAALRWVHDNITAFGGDPSRVTIFGESAGSWSVHALQSSPLAAGLIHRVIGESGTVFGSLVRLHDDSAAGEAAEKAGERFAAALLDGEDVTLEALRAASVEQVLEAVRKPGVRFPSRGNVDGWFLPDTADAIFEAGKQNDVPVIAGWNHDEGRSLLGSSGPTTLDGLKSWAERACPGKPETLLDIYQPESEDDVLGAYQLAWGIQVFGEGARRWAALTENASSPAYLYHFTRVPPGAGGTRYGAYHAVEIPYAFDNLDQLTLEGPDVVWEDADRRLSDVMASYWVNFAATGDPNGPGLPEWPIYHAESDRAIVLGDDPGAQPAVRKQELDAFAACAAL